MKKILIIQTASIGDVILATPILEELHRNYPEAAIDFLVKRGNERLFDGHPFLNEILIWDKSRDKYGNLLAMLYKIRATRYDLVVNAQRFLSTGMLTAFSRGKKTVGFSKNPLAFLFKVKVHHTIESGNVHEVDRNLGLLRAVGINTEPATVRLYPQEKDHRRTASFQDKPYITISPASLWFTKQYPVEKWVEFIRAIPGTLVVYFLGSTEDVAFIHEIMDRSGHPSLVSLAGKLTLLESASLMMKAKMNFVNDSAPMHLCSAVDAKVTAIFCSTVPAYGFGPLSTDAVVVETNEDLHCRPCGLHGLRTCPEGHYRCAFSIQKEWLIRRIPQDVTPG